MRPVAAALAVAALVAAPAASANGRFPAAQHVAIGKGSEVLALRATFGVLASRDGGARFDFLCEESLGYAGEVDPPIAIDGSGRIHVGLFDGLVRTDEGHCSAAKKVDALKFTDLDQDPTGRTIVATQVEEFVSGAPLPKARIFRSSDGGETFAPARGVLEGVLLETLEIAPSQPERLWLAGATTPPRRAVVYRSDDGGDTLHEVPFSIGLEVESAWISGIDKTDPDAVWIRAVVITRSPSGGSVPAGTALVRTTDGGKTFRVVARTEGSFLGFALSDDGQTVWVGGPGVGLLRSTDRGERFEKISTLGVRCLRQHGGVLWACGDDFSDGFALARSTDGGARFEPALRFCDLEGPPSCAGSGASTTSICGAPWLGVRALLGCEGRGGDAGVPAVDAGADGSAAVGDAATADAGRPDPSPTVEPSGGCSFGRDLGSGVLLGSIVAASALLARARARRHA